MERHSALTSCSYAHFSQASTVLSGCMFRISSPRDSKVFTSSAENGLPARFSKRFTCELFDSSVWGGSRGGVGGALVGTKAGRGIPLRCLTQRSLHDCHVCRGFYIKIVDQCWKRHYKGLALPSPQAACILYSHLSPHLVVVFAQPKAKVSGHLLE